LIEQGRLQVAVSVNATMTMLYWQVGKRINEAVLKEKRAEYGEQIVVSLARQLTEETVRVGVPDTYIIVYALRRLFRTSKL